MKKDRFEAFTDAVIAIILTILVLEIRLPTNNHSLSALIDIAPQFFAYIFSFILISTMWVNHHNLFMQVKTINNQTLWLNIILLFWSSLLPSTTAWIGTSMMSRVPAVLYALNVTLYNLSFGMLRENVIKYNKIIKARRKLERVSFLINIISLLGTFFWSPLVFIGLIINVLLWSLPHIFTNNN